MNYNWDPLKNILDRLPEDTVSRAAACINRHRRIFVYAFDRLLSCGCEGHSFA